MEKQLKHPLKSSSCFSQIFLVCMPEHLQGLCLGISACPQNTGSYLTKTVANYCLKKGKKTLSGHCFLLKLSFMFSHSIKRTQSSKIPSPLVSNLEKTYLILICIQWKDQKWKFRDLCCTVTTPVPQMLFLGIPQKLLMNVCLWCDRVGDSTELQEERRQYGKSKYFRCCISKCV